jgi:hypothetical protein
MALILFQLTTVTKKYRKNSLSLTDRLFNTSKTNISCWSFYLTLTRVLPVLFLTLVDLTLQAQGCCSGGSGSPIAGGASQGVLQERQMEFAISHQYLSSDKFLVGDRDTTSLFDNLNSNYLYGRVAYGVTEKLTVSLESGYFLNKTQYGLERNDTVKSGGFADLILFPRYNLFTHNTEKTKTEITIGVGLKIPIGKFKDSTVVYRDPRTNAKYYTTAPPTVQPTSGSNDFIFYGFLFRGYNEKKFRVFANMLYIRKGWNPLGMKFGDYSSVGLFASQTILKKLVLTLQFRGEFVPLMKYDKNVDMLALYNIDVLSTGSRKVFIAPQISFSAGHWIFYSVYETPLYQYVNGTQVGSKHQLTTGISYRFFTKSAE